MQKCMIEQVGQSGTMTTHAIQTTRQRYTAQQVYTSRHPRTDKRRTTRNRAKGLNVKPVVT